MVQNNFLNQNTQLILGGKRYDWCSDVGYTLKEHPFIAVTMKSKKFKFNGYTVRSGCCYEGCCCGIHYSYCVDCYLYSWSLQISDNYKDWITVHHIEKDNSIQKCADKTFSLDKEYSAKYVRLIQDSPYPSLPPCIALNRFELFGEVLNDYSEIDEAFNTDIEDEDEGINIIGRISKSD